MTAKSLISVLIVMLVPGVGAGATAVPYRGPVGEVPAALFAPSSDGPIGTARLNARGRRLEGWNRWEFWWEMNRDRYLRAHLVPEDAGASKALAPWSAPHDLAARVTEEDVRGRILPVLLAGLESPDPEERWIAAIGLGRAGIAEAFGPLKKLLEAGTFTDRRAAAISLGMLGEPLAAPALVDLLKRHGVSASERAYAAIGLGLLGVKETATPLRRALAEGLSRRGSDYEELQAAAISALGLLGDRDAVGLLSRVVTANGNVADEVRAAALIALGRIGASESEPVLLAALRSGDPDVRRAATQALGLLGRTDTRKALAEVYRTDGDVLVRAYAGLALAKIGGPEAGPILESGLALRNSRTVREFSALALGILGDRDRVPALRKLLEAKDEPGLAGAASIAVALIGDRGSLSRLRAIAESEARDDDLRGYAVLALAMLDDPVNRSRIPDQARTRRSANVRRSATLAIGLHPELRAGPVLLRSLLEESDPYVKGAVVSSLKLMPRRSVVDELVLYSTESSRYSTARKDALTALGVLAARGAPASTERMLEEINYRSLTDALEQVTLIF